MTTYYCLVTFQYVPERKYNKTDFPGVLIHTFCVNGYDKFPLTLFFEDFL